MRLPPLPTLAPIDAPGRVVGDRPTQVTKPITISPYDPDWPGRFRREEARIRAALGTAALAIDHVGSTAVPGLAGDEHLRHLILRDWLRAHPDDRDRYEAGKRAAAAASPMSMSGYVAGKTDVILDILRRAGLR